MSNPLAIAQLADLVSADHPHDPQAFELIAEALSDIYPDAAEAARLNAALLRESERKQEVFSQILEEAKSRELQ